MPGLEVTVFDKTSAGDCCGENLRVVGRPRHWALLASCGRCLGVS